MRMKLFGDFHKMKATGDLKETDSFEHNGLAGAHVEPYFKSINSLALCFLYGPNLTSIHDY